jgi:2'-5' RNA ligase
MRLFVALDIDDDIRQRIVGFMESVRGLAPQARWVRPESLHVTLKFIGGKPEEDCERIRQVLRMISIQEFELTFRGYGFFPTKRAARVFWIGMEAGAQLASLAASIDAGLAAMGVPKEEHGYTPHLTLARAAGGSGAPRRQKGDRTNPSFQPLQEKLSALPQPEFGTMKAREFFLYRSQLSPGGSIYSKIAAFPLDQPGTH